MNGWELNGSAVGLNANHAGFEDAGGLHIGVLGPSENNWAGYFAISPLTPAHLFHARITLPDARPITGMVDDAVYIQQEMFQDPRIDAMGCGADIYPTEIHWTVSLQAGDATHEIINRSVYSDNSANQPTSRECTLVTNGDNQLVAYMDGQKVFSSNSMNLNMPEPFQYYLELQSNSVTPSTGASMFTGAFTDYYATTSDSIKVLNAGAGSVIKVVDITSGNTLATSIAGQDGTAFVDVGKYHMPINADVQVFDSAGINLLATTSANSSLGGGIYGGDVFNVGSAATQTTTITVNSIGLGGTPITGLFTTVARGTTTIATGFTPFQFAGLQDATYIVTVYSYGSHIFDHWDDNSRVSGRTITPTTPTLSLTASYREDTDPAPPTSLTSLTQYTTNNNSPTITGNAHSGYSVQLYDNNQIAIANPVNVPASGLWSINTQTLSDGRHFISSKAIDGSGNVSPFSSPITMTIDTVIPTVSIGSNTVSSNGQVNLAGQSSDSGSEIRIIEVGIDNAPAPFVAATPHVVGDWSTWTFTTGAGQLAPGLHHLTARATDYAGNQGISAVDITIPNNTPPPPPPPGQSTITVNSADTDGAPVTGLYTTLTQNGVVTMTGFTPVSFAVNSGQTYIVSVSDYGTNYFDHWQTSTSGNVNTRDITVTTTTVSDTSLAAVYRHTP